MAKAPVDIVKYVISAKVEAKGLVEKPDLIGAIFGQTEGLLGGELDLRELQKSGRIGRIDAKMETKGGITRANVEVPSSLDMVETSIIAAGIETITRVGPCDAKFTITEVKDIRESKRTDVVNRAKEILKTMVSKEIPDAKEISEEVRKEVRSEESTKYKGLDAGPAVATSESVILVEGRADVINLLKSDIKNAIAIGGIKTPKEVIEICNKKTSTAFLDGDRGGDLILKSLKQAGAELDYVARAPIGREVEELSRKEMVMALRRKVSAEQALDDLKKPAGRREEGKSSRDGRDNSKSRSSRDRGSRDRSSRDRDRSKDGSSRDRDKAPSEKKDEDKKGDVNSKLLSILDGIKNEAVVLDEKLKEKKKVALKDVKKENLSGYAFVIDDIITQNVLSSAEGCKYIVGITTADNLKTPKDKVLLTKF